jgi:hypothetical protein
MVNRSFLKFIILVKDSPGKGHTTILTLLKERLKNIKMSLLQGNGFHIKGNPNKKLTYTLSRLIISLMGIP